MIIKDIRHTEEAVGIRHTMLYFFDEARYIAALVALGASWQICEHVDPTESPFSRAIRLMDYVSHDTAQQIAARVLS